MKRIGGLYEKIYSMENITLADQKARRGKKKSYGVKLHDRNRQSNLVTLHENLKNRTYKTSQYTIFRVTQRGKEREIYRLPYFPDRICHHAVMNILEPVWMKVFTADTYSCIKNRGVHLAVKRIKSALRQDPENTAYCLKLDIHKYYPSIDHGILKNIIRRKIKDIDLLWLLDEIIDSAPGVPIGNYLSQFFANLYLAYFDHWIKEELKVKYYYRYCDDMVILSCSKDQLHRIHKSIEIYLHKKLKLQVKSNHQVFPVASRGIDFLGYVFFPDHTRLRKSIKQAFAGKVSKMKDKSEDIIKRTMAAYWGWAKHCDSRHLIKVLTL